MRLKGVLGFKEKVKGFWYYIPFPRRLSSSSDISSAVPTMLALYNLIDLGLSNGAQDRGIERARVDGGRAVLYSLIFQESTCRRFCFQGPCQRPPCQHRPESLQILQTAGDAASLPLPVPLLLVGLSSTMPESRVVA